MKSLVQQLADMSPEERHPVIELSVEFALADGYDELDPTHISLIPEVKP